ncbi:MAG: class I SAM-dependent methyltransferase, partial [Gemmatimonadota bacterium]|nr:class I SAM-dependent methyltransferase [Gemmatimonadota bacterium]
MSQHPMHEANRRGWDAVSAQWQAEIDARVDWRSIPANIQLVLDDVELRYLGDVSGRSVCVLGSGDNLVAFTLAAAGAQVTSVDISEVQLEIAAGRAGELGLSIAFHRADVIDLGGPGGLPDGHFDIVYTGGHVAVWVSDLKRYYGEGIRILKPGGLFMVNEYHPFRRLWKHGSGPLRQEFHYFDHGPFTYDRSEELPEVTGPLPSYEFHWAVSDMIRALLEG